MEEPLHIALASPALNAWSETFIAAHIERLHHVDLLLTDGEPPRQASPGGPLARTSWWGRWADKVFARRFGGMPGLLRHRLYIRLREQRPQVLLAEYGSAAASILEPCVRAGVPLVVHFHGVDAHRLDYIERYAGYRDVFAYAKALVVVSRVMEKQLLALGAPREKVVYNCYGIDVDRFLPGDPATSGPHFLAVGRFTAKKAPQLTIQAFKRLHEQWPDARLTMVGHGKLWDECRELIGRLGLGDVVDLCGVKKPDEIAALMRRSRAFVQHSVVTQNNDHEGTPLAVLEAMASAIPVVSTRHAGIVDVVAEGERGLLCDEHDVAAMAAAMLRLAADPELARRMGRAGRAYVEVHHRVEVQVGLLQGILRRAAHHRA